jgi:hypothetical protein
MTRRLWFRNLLAALTGIWAASRAPAGPTRPAPQPAPAPRPAPAVPELRWVATYTYDAAGCLVGVEGPWITTAVYDAGSGRSDG